LSEIWLLDSLIKTPEECAPLIQMLISLCSFVLNALFLKSVWYGNRVEISFFMRTEIRARPLGADENNQTKNFNMLRGISK